MNAEIIAVGTEILLGDITNTHARYLAQKLAALGIDLLHQSVVGDNRERLTAALQEALQRSDIVILTGGLGPTNDDLTKETACELMGVELQLDQEALRRMQAYFDRTGRDMPEINKKQAMLPVGGTVFYNDYGTAPGMAVEKDGKCVILLPGPPRELTPMFEQQVRPFLEKFSDGKIVSHTLAATGIGESAVAEKLGSLLENDNPTAALYAKDGEVHIRVTAKAANATEAEQCIAPMINEIKRRLGDYIYGMDEPSLQSVVIGLLREQKLMIATAESCTGGMLAQRLTEISGASDVYEFGVTSYSNKVKEKALGIPEEILKRCGAVSSEVAMLMAAGAQREGDADIGVGITGIAGPGGGTPETPVGCVFVAVTYHDKYWVEKLSIGHGGINERDYIRGIATLHALNMVRLVLVGASRAIMALAELPELPIAPRIVAPPVQMTERATAAVDPNWTISAATVEPEWAAAEPIIDPERAVAEPIVDPERIAEESAEIAEEEPEEEEKAPWYKRLLRYFFPWKGDTPVEIIRKVVFMVALLTLIGSAVYIGDYLNAHIQSDIVYGETISLYNKQPTQTELAKLPNGYLEKFAALYSQNTDIAGWITIPNSRVDHPVVKTDNNDYYLGNDFDKNENRYGVPFIDWRCRFGLNEDGTTMLSTNTIIYGHNGANGKMFCDVKNYYSSLSFYKNSPVITFDTVYEESQWKVIAAFMTNGNDDGDGYYFDYHNFVEAQSEEHFDWFIRQIRSRSVLDIPDEAVDVKYGDKLLTLSTCSEQRDLRDGRVVVVARKVREDESAWVDVSKVTRNENPQYPNAWYKQHDLENPGWPSDPNPLDGGNGQTGSQETSSTIPDDSSTADPTVSEQEPSRDDSSTEQPSSDTTTSEAASSTPPASSEAASSDPPASSEAASSAPPASSEAASSTPPASSEAASSTPPASSEAASSAPPASSEAASSAPPVSSEAENQPAA